MGHHSAELMGLKGGKISSKPIGQETNCMVVLRVTHGRSMAAVRVFIVMAGVALMHDVRPSWATTTPQLLRPSGIANLPRSQQDNEMLGIDGYQHPIYTTRAIGSAMWSYCLF